jgi:hypothetical protein
MECMSAEPRIGIGDGFGPAGDAAFGAIVVIRWGFGS